MHSRHPTIASPSRAESRPASSTFSSRITSSTLVAPIRLPLRILSLAVLATTLLACEPYESAHMEPGEDCMSCHIDSRLRWTISGTVYADPKAQAHEGIGGAEVLVTDANGRELTLKTNSSGNFYTREEVRFPIRVSVRHGDAILTMPKPAIHGSCNGCHNDPPKQEATGRVFVR